MAGAADTGDGNLKDVTALDAALNEIDVFGEAGRECVVSIEAHRPALAENLPAAWRSGECVPGD